jgi:hypothetical protein
VKRLLVALVLVLVVTASAAGSVSAPPPGLTLYGRLTWNLDALVHDFYGGSRTCFRQQTRTIHRCGSPGFNDGLYRVTFRSARYSSFRAVQVNNPVGNVNVVGLRIGGRYIRCGADSWIAFTNASGVWGEPLFCIHA